MYGIHFTLRDTHAAFYRKCWDDPEGETLYVHCDFKQADTLPVGPVETGSWWYAGSRLAITVLTFITWGPGLPRQYNTYCSHILDQSAGYVVSCMEDLLTRVVDVKGFKKMLLFADVGNHCRASVTVAYWTGGLLDKFPFLQSTEIVFFPEHHGKGPVDGHFGKMAAWKHNTAKSRVISSLRDYVTIMQERADEAHEYGKPRPGA